MTPKTRQSALPIALIDTKNKAIGSAHCGWRGTFASLSEKTFREMNCRFSTTPEDIISVIGPCICRNCYEVSEDLYNQFIGKFGKNEGIVKKDNKYYLDLALINKLTLIKCGVPENNITISDLCTCCNKKDLYSHRGLGPERGIFASVISLT